MTVEDVEQFRLRARDWLSQNMPPAREPEVGAVEDDHAWLRARELQQRLHAGGFAGICFPREYGGLGLTPAHQRAFDDEALGYEMPLLLNVPTLGICAPTILDMAGDQQKRTHLPAVIRGEEVLVQFLSEPKGGSDLAGCITRADRDGDRWVLNGAKIWSSGAYAADYGLCLARTDWDAPKHRGLTMFLVKIDQPGVNIRRIKQVNGSTEFCEEFFDNVVLPPEAVLGEVGGGWQVVSRQLFHERNAKSGGSPYMSGRGERSGRAQKVDLLALAREVGVADDPRVRELVGEMHAARIVRDQLNQRVSAGIAAGELDPSAASMNRLFAAEVDWLESDAGLEIAGSAAVTGPPEGGPTLEAGRRYLFRQATSVGGGTTEMSRNMISERLLGMPREFAPDHGVPFSQVRQGRNQT